MSTPTMRPVSVRAAGAILWRPAGPGVELALVHRPRYDDWSFPKGKLDRGETMPFAAVREIVEETGVRARLSAVLGDVRYDVPEGPKLVRYWSAEAVGGEFSANAETDELRWVAPDKAGELLSYRRDVDLLARFARVGVATSTLLLVRHAKAGSRGQWDGDDCLRPLSGSGREQAVQLAGLLSLFGPDRVSSAPPVRCRATVAPLAARLGTDIGDEPLLGESGYWSDPDAGLARLRRVATGPGVTVLCSQGGVIPDVVASLVEAGTGAAGNRSLGVDPDDVPARKASTWVLTFDGAQLRTADHYPHPTGG